MYDLVAIVLLSLVLAFYVAEAARRIRQAIRSLVDRPSPLTWRCVFAAIVSVILIASVPLYYSTQLAEKIS